MAERSAPERGFIGTLDWKLILLWLVLVLIGWLNIYAAVRSAEPSSIFDFSCNCGRQALWIGTSLILALLIMFVLKPGIWETLSTPGYLAVTLLLIAVIFLSKDVKGSHSWFEFGPVKFQPAELSKITTSLLLATLMSRPNFKLTTAGNFLRALLIIGLPMMIIVLEDETGSALVYVGFLFALYREGMSGWILFMLFMAVVLCVLALVTGPWVPMFLLAVVCLVYWLRVVRTTRRGGKSKRRSALVRTLTAFAAGVMLVFATGYAFNKALKPYQQARIEVLLGLKDDPSGVGYNVRQSMIAIGSGGFWGKGYLQGTQTTFGFVPEQSTDFIFCTVGEEWGFVGCLLVILLYALMIWRILEDSETARSSFTRVYGYCLASCLFMHLFINISMTVGLMPVIGIPLPFLSYGGSSMWAFTAMLFIFLALDRQEKKYF